MSATALLAPLLRPARELPATAGRRHFWEPLLFATAAALLFAILAIPRLDFEKAAVAAMDRQENSAQMSPHDREEKIATVRRVGSLAAYTGASFGPAANALALALLLWLAFKVAGGRPSYAGAFTVSAWSLVPGAVESLLSIPGLLVQGARVPIDPEAASRILPASLGALLPAGSDPRLEGFLWSVNAFSLWAVYLVAVGMAGVAGVSRRRALVVSTLLWLSYVGVFKVALPAMSGGRPA